VVWCVLWRLDVAFICSGAVLFLFFWHVNMSFGDSSLAAR
jgi:hypothetical protein